MAWETIDGNEAVIVAKIETTSGEDEDPTIGDDDAPWEEFEWTINPSIRKRRIISPHEPGSGHSLGLTTLGWSAKQTMQLRSITAGDDTDVPSFHLAARISGWTWQGNATDKSHTYFLQRKDSTTATIKEHRAHNGANAYNTTELLGAMADFEFSFEAGEPWMFDLVDGFALTQDPSAMFGQGGAALNTSYVHQSAADVRAESNVIRVYIPGAAPTLYGGGTLGTPDQTVDLVSLKFKGNRSIAQQKTVGGSFGVKRQRPDNSESPTVEFVLEQTGYDDFNPFALLMNGTKLYLGFDGTSPSNALVKARGAMYCQLTDVKDGGDVDGRRTWVCTADLVWVADVADNDPAPGTSPSQAWAAGAAAPDDLGLFIDTNITPPNGALAFIQVFDATP